MTASRWIIVVLFAMIVLLVAVPLTGLACGSG